MPEINLWEPTTEFPIELLPYDGATLYYGSIMYKATADNYLATLLSDIAWQHDEAIIFGKKIITKRKVAWYGDRNFEYTYSKITKQALPWTDPLLALKKMVEVISGTTYNACLLNLYHNGQEGMAWHSDDEKDLQKNGAIASLSLGAPRKFALKHKKSKETISLILEHGSLLVMKDTTQSHWLHKLPTTTKIDSPRVNLTFRSMELR
ncbi:alpha-ketoglutarate-dependent dioxygenase AlkB [Taibaiella sp. KBW10]|uniref:alpha-ketoglutarate-dependent dioxygenase AlkB family protein n=1 Tax=Taibaiella sp. KBW10 TaxID=2153357 RepID=UPI000F5B19C5|nr:alpha-ketoglutarate-dependent dioxygenase AlkB [Taibaiella sp. KBW10]RQO30220.1 alpha-ketoglutarate-dependent dioxygenase AlkB [Taibaiella sp. KBW10]